MIETDRLILKEHTIENVEKLFKWFNDKELVFLDDDEPFEPVAVDKVRSHLENRLMKCGFNDDKDIIHIAIHTKAQNFIGYCMIAHIDRYNGKCKIGMTIGEKSEWGKGYGKEALGALLEYCFETLTMNRVGAEIYSMNNRSIRLFESCGFIREGSIRESVLKNHEYADEYIYGLLKREWKRHRI